MPVLLRVFPQGLDSREAQQAARLREAYEDWLERGAKHPVSTTPGFGMSSGAVAIPELAHGGKPFHRLQAVMANVGEVLRPDMVLQHDVADGSRSFSSGCTFAGRISRSRSAASSGRRRHSHDGVAPRVGSPMAWSPMGKWMLVSAQGRDHQFASWYADLWMQEPLTLRAFHSFLHLRRLVGVATRRSSCTVCREQ
jgi:hypothetical protein